LDAVHLVVLFTLKASFRKLGVPEMENSLTGVRQKELISRRRQIQFQKRCVHV